MDKKLLAFICITIISIFGAAVFGVLYYNPDNFVFPDGHDFRQNGYERFIRTEHSLQSEPNAPVNKLIGGICALLLLGYLFVICYQ